MNSKLAGIVFYFSILIATLAPSLTLAADRIPPEFSGSADMRALEDEMKAAVSAASAVTGREFAQSIQPEKTPEKEIERRRNLINGAYKDFQIMNGAASATAASGGSKFEGERASPETGRGGRLLENPETPPGEASARDNSPLEAELASRGSHPIPPQAIPVEGKITIVGGEGNASASDPKNVELKYTVEEKFVGNLIIAVDADENGRASEKEYMLDTLSTSILVKSLEGSSCAHMSEHDRGTCIDRDAFSSYEVQKNNRYPEFHSGVVAAQTEGGKIKIEASSPDVRFLTARRTKSLNLNCSNAEFELTQTEFDRLIKQGQVNLTKDVGNASASDKCRTGSSITLEMRIKK